MKIKAAVTYEKSGKFIMDQLELEEPREDEVLVKIAGAGICHTDLAARDQHLPIPLPGVLGHEGAGVVEKAGKRVTKVQPGDHVVMSWGYCGRCPECKKGNTPWCHAFFPKNFFGQRLDGSTTMKKGDQVIHGSFFCQSSFANYALGDELSVIKVREDIPLEVLAPMGCGVMTGAGAVINTFHATAGCNLAVFGAGTVGMSAILAAVVTGYTQIIAVDLHEDRLKMAKEFGATHTIKADDGNPVEAIQELTGGGADYSLECVGNNQVFRQAVDCLRIGGTCGLIGAAPTGMEAGLDMQTCLNGRTIKGIIEGDATPDLFIPTLIELYSQGRFPYDKLITYYPFEEINKAVEDMEKGVTIKPVLKL